MSQSDPASAGGGRGPALLEPLRESTYRTIWLASLLSNFGQLIQGVGAAWEMTRLTASSPGMVALVQTAIMLPLMLLSLPSGAIADMFDRRRVALTGLLFACVSALGLTVCSWLGLVTPWLLLTFCFLIGAGVALYGPAWQASIGEQVRAEHLPAAIALGSISYNVARSFGPAIGGVIVATVGAVAAFGANALLYVPLMIAFWRWRRVPMPSRLPPERIDRAIISGMRYAIHSPPIRVVLIRTLVTGLGGASVSALTPLVAGTLLGGGAGTYGLLLGAYGVGAVIGATMVSQVRSRMSPEGAARLLALATAIMLVIVGISHNLLLSCAALLVAGALWMILIALLNVSVQLTAPRWVTARALSCFSAAITAGMAFGAWGWGALAGEIGIGGALVASGIAVGLSPIMGLFSPLPDVPAGSHEHGAATTDPDVALALTLRSGPIVIEIDYHVETARARDYYQVMQQLRGARLRTGGFEWSLSRDVAVPELWTERYHFPTWGDYLRQRDRATLADRELQAMADGFHDAPPENRVRRRLERPFGSVRWRAETPDRQDERLPIYPP